MAHYLVTRPDVFHTAPLAVMVAVLATWAVAEVAGERGAKRSESLLPGRGGRAGTPLYRVITLAGAGLAMFAIAYATIEGLDRRWLELRADRVALDLPIADGVRVREDTARPLERTVRSVQRRTRPGEPIYVTTRRSDLVTAGAPLLYLLAGRPNPTRYDIAAPGVVTTEPVQREIVEDLERSRVRFVVRWTAPASAAPEPNKAGESSGVPPLDDYLASTYRRVGGFGDYVLLERR
jgi:hypothetical protein